MHYQNTVIYKISCKDNSISNCYVGHTTNFQLRKQWHYWNSILKSNKLYDFIAKNGGFDNFDMVMLERYPCENIQTARQRERYWIDKLHANLNSCLPSRTKNEYNKDNKEIIALKGKEYRQAHKDEIKMKRCLPVTCSCGAIIQKKEISRHLKTKTHFKKMNELNNCAV